MLGKSGSVISRQAGQRAGQVTQNPVSKEVAPFNCAALVPEKLAPRTGANALEFLHAATTFNRVGSYRRYCLADFSRSRRNGSDGRVQPKAQRESAIDTGQPHTADIQSGEVRRKTGSADRLLET